MGATIFSFTRRHKTLVGGTFAIVVLAVVFLVIFPQIASWQDVKEVVREISWQWLLALTVAATLNVLTFALPRMAVIPGLSFRPALTLHLATAASVFVLPGGAVLGFGLSFAMLKGWGYQARIITVGLTVGSVWNQFIILGAPPVSFALLTMEGGADPLLNTFVWVGLIGTVVIGVGFAASLYSAELAQRFGDSVASVVSGAMRLFRRGPVTWGGESFARFQQGSRQLLRTRWHVITLTALVAQLSIFLVLLVALRAVGVSADEVSLVEAFAAWSLIRVAGSLPIVPGGLGIVELGLTAALVGFGADNAEAVATVILYRVFTTGPVLMLGALAGATWQRQHPGWREETSAGAIS